MKRKPFFFLFVLLMGICGVFGSINLTTFFAHAASVSASVWNGGLGEDGNLTGASGSGQDWVSEGNNHYILSAKGLAHFANQVNGGNNFQNNSIYLETDVDWNNKAFKSIGSESAPFMGYFDAQGHTIFNVKVDDSGLNGSAAGFFGVTGANAYLKNINLKNISVSVASDALSNAAVGGIVGFATSGTYVENCSVSGSIKVFTNSKTNYSIGGVVGGGDVSVVDGKSEVDITASGSVADNSILCIGGVVGQMSGNEISRVANLGNIVTEGAGATAANALVCVGGIVGKVAAEGSLKNSYNVGTINSGNGTSRTHETVGGVVGMVDSGVKFDVQNVYNAGEINCSAGDVFYVAGLIGNSSSNSVKFEGGFMVGQMQLPSTVSPTLNCNLLFNGNVTFENVYIDSSQNYEGRESVKVQNLTYLAKTREFYRNNGYFSQEYEKKWDFDNVWTISTSSNNSLPTLKESGANEDQSTTAPSDDKPINLLGAGTAAHPYQIWTVGDLASLADVDFSKNQNKYFALQTNLDISGKVWRPISDFTGVFDGNNHKISGLRSNVVNGTLPGGGIFASTQNAMIKNLIVGKVSFVKDKTLPTLIGKVEGKTYLVNVADENLHEEYELDGSVRREYPTVGDFVTTSSLTVAYGRNNYNGSETPQNQILISNGSFSTLFDVMVNGGGGSFFDTEEKTAWNGEDIYLGEYHILLNSSGEVVNPEIDSTFGKTMPTGSEGFGSADVLIKPGYRLSGFKCKNTDWILQGNLWQLHHKAAAFGLDAQFEKVDVTIRVIYNQYEIDKLGAKPVNVNYGSFSAGGKNFVIENENGKVYVDYTIPYDTYLSDISYIAALPANLRGGQFSIERLYSQVDANSNAYFGGNQINELLYNSISLNSVLVNDAFIEANGGEENNTRCNFYAKWRGKKNLADSNNTLTINFVSKDKKISKDDLADIINNVTLFENEGKFPAVEAPSVTKTITDFGVSFGFNLKSFFSATREEWYGFKVDVKSGYAISGAPVVSVDNTVDTNFGVLSTSFGSFSTSGGLNNVNNFQNLEKVAFYNLLGHTTIEIGVARMQYQDNFSTQGDLLFGLSPFEKFVVTKQAEKYVSNVRIFTGEGYEDLLEAVEVAPETLESLSAEGQDNFVAFDILNNKILFSTGTFDSVDFNFADRRLNNTADLIFTNLAGQNPNDEAANKRSYIISKRAVEGGENVVTNTLVLYDGNEKENLLSVALETVTTQDGTENVQKLTEKNFSYTAGNSFVLIASTENGGVNFSSCQYQGNATFVESTGVVTTDLSVAGNEENAQQAHNKKMFAFNNVIKENKDGQDKEGNPITNNDEVVNNQNIANNFEIVSQYTDATFFLNLVYDTGALDEETAGAKLEKFKKNMPKVVFWQDGKEDVANGKVVKVTESDGSFGIAFTPNYYYNFDGGNPYGMPQQSAVLWNGTNTPNFKFSVSDVAFQAEGEDTSSPDDYMTQFNADNTGILSVKNSWDVTKNFYNFEIGYTNKLKAGRYNIDITCTDMLYQANFGSKYVKFDDINGASDETVAELVNSSTSVESSSTISTSVNGQAVSKGKTGKLEELLYDNNLSISTDSSTEKGYDFFGWMMQSAGKTTLVKGAQNLDRKLQEFYESKSKAEAVYADEGLEEIENVLNLWAVYVQKQFKLLLNGSVVVENFNGKGSNLNTTASGLGLNFSMESTAISDGTYQYDFSTSSDKKPAGMTLDLGNSNGLTTGQSDGYYLVGFNVVDNTGKAVNILKGDNFGKAITSNMSWVWEKINSGAFISGGSAQAYYLQPIIKQKTAQILLHSGAQAGSEFNQSGIGGHVYNQNGKNDSNETTNKTYSYGETGQTIYFESFVNLKDQTLLYKDEATEVSLSLKGDTFSSGNNIYYYFNSRTGYTLKTSDFWSWKVAGGGSGILSSNALSLGYNFFVGSQTTAQIHLYLNWVANSYTIRYDSNGSFAINDSKPFGVVTGATANTTAVYDGTTVMAENGFAFVGYEFVGWAKDKNEKDTSKLYDAGKDYVGENFCTGDGADTSITLYAIWEAKEYEVEINFNGGEDAKQQPSKNFKIVYNTTFANLLDESAAKVGIESIVATRAGFNLVGYFVDNNGQAIQVTNLTKLDTNLLLADFDTKLCLTIYANWQYVENFASLTIANNLLTFTYNGDFPSVFVANYFKPDNFSANNITVLRNGNELSYHAAAPFVEISTILTSASEAAKVVGDQIFVKDAGTYSFAYTITLSDTVSHFNKGDVQKIVVYLSLTIEKANLEMSLADGLKVLNAKKLLENFVQFDGDITSLEGLANFVRELEGEASFIVDGKSASNLEIYDYVIVKYFLLLTSNDSTQYRIFKEWTYSKFLSYKQENAENVATILQNMTFFTFYGLPTDEQIADYERYIILSNNAVAGVSADISLQTGGVKIFSVSSFQARNTYSLRVYLNSRPNLKNYNLSVDSMGNYYYDAGKAYLLPMPLKVTNSNVNRSTFFSSRYTNREVGWQFDAEAATFFNQTYYKVGEIDSNPLYAYTRLFTSNSGAYNKDVIFGYKNVDNYLYFSDMNVRLQVGSNLLDYTSNFTFVLSADDVYTIRKVSDVIYFTMSANYLTIVDGTQYCDVIDQQNSNLSHLALPNDLMNIDTVSYDLKDGLGEREVKVSEVEGFRYTAPEDAHTLIYEILVNNANVVSLYLNTVVTSVKFTASTNAIGEYISLHKWHEGEYEIDGVDTTGGLYALDNLTVDMTGVTTDDEELTTISYSAIYTDLVKVELDTSIPENAGISLQNEFFIRLGFVTDDTFAYPLVSGFKCASLTLDGYGIDITTHSGKAAFFAGEGGTYVGMNADNKRATLRFSAKWAVEQISGAPLKTHYRTAVSSFDRLYASDVARIYNENINIYNYTYTWYKQDNEGSFTFMDEDGVERKYKLLPTDGFLTLEEKGSVNESGKYRLFVAAQLKSEFVSCLKDPSKTETSFSVGFELEFMLNLLQNITFPSENQTVFDNLNHIDSWRVNFEYFVFDSEADDYNSYLTTSSQGFVEEGAIFFEVYYGGDKTTGTKVTEMKNAGIYTIYAYFQDGKFDTSSYNGGYSFTYTILPKDLDLGSSSFNFNVEKKFNAEFSEAFDQDITISGSEVAHIAIFRKDTNLDVGEYGLYLGAVQSNNYVYKLGEVVLYENGSLTAAGESTQIGMLSIVTAGTLRLSYEISETLGEKIDAPFSTLGYSIALEDNFVLKITDVATGAIFKQIQLLLFDGANQISRPEILEILNSKLSDITAKFMLGKDTAAIAQNSGLYGFAFELGETFAQNFETVEMDQRFGFEISAITINIQALEDAGLFTKVYDGGKIGLFDVPDYEGLQIELRFASAHVSSRILADVQLKTTENSSLNLANFKPSKTTAYGQITARKATISFKMTATDNVYTYGNISTSDFATLISVDKILVEDEEGNLVDVAQTLLEVGYYNLSFALAGDVKANSRGKLFAGSYDVSLAGCSFDDFDATLSPLSFSVVQKDFTLQIPSRYITITTDATLEAAYERQQTIDDTGDVLNLSFVVLDADGNAFVAGQTLPRGEYALSVVGATDGKLVVSVDENDALGSVRVIVPSNTGFNVVEPAKTLTVSIESGDEAKLVQTYFGGEYFLSINADKKLQINKFSTGELVDTLNLVFSTQGEVEGFEFESVAIYSGVSTNNKFKKASSYLLSLDATIADGTYANAVFDKEYRFVVSPCTIDVENLVLSKEYDGLASHTVQEFGQVSATDNVSLFVSFQDANVGVDKPVNLLLQGSDAANYLLSSSTWKATITKAQAMFVFGGKEYDYGKISMQNGQLNSILLSDVSVVSSAGKPISSAQYQIAISIDDATSEDFTQLGYLRVKDGGYHITISDVIENANYDIAALEVSITIKPFHLSINFTEEGEISVEYGTALDGNKVPYTMPAAPPLYEKVDFNFERYDASNHVGLYALNCEKEYLSLDGNYIASITDEKNAAFEIASPDKRVYVLLTDQFGNAKDVQQVEFTYDGKVYDGVTVSKNATTGNWELVIYSTTDSSLSHAYALGFFVLEGGEYVAQNYEDVESLSAEMFFRAGQTPKDAREYQISAPADKTTSSVNVDTRMGKESDLYAFTVKILPKEIYFNLDATTEDGQALIESGIFKQTFNNALAQYSFTDSGLLLNGLVEGDSVQLSVTFKNGSEIAKYVSSTLLGVEAEIVDNGNYFLAKAATQSGTLIRGQITPATLKLFINNQSFEYGKFGVNTKLAYHFEADGFDFETYLAEIELLSEKRVFEESVSVVKPTYSSSNFLNAKEYALSLGLNASDFLNVQYFVDGVEQTALTAKLQITPKILKLVDDGNLQQIFTKKYDGTTDAKIYEGGVLRFALQENIFAADNVRIASAAYSALKGQGLEVSFVLESITAGTDTDFENYVVESFKFGVIEDVKIALSFDYHHLEGVISNVTNMGRVEISELSFPFTNGAASLNANASVNSTKYFPTLLWGYEGRVFSGWQMIFENVTQAQLALLSSIASVQDLGGNTYAVKVGDDGATAAFISHLLEDDKDVFGKYYYANHNNIEVVFSPVWTVAKQKLSVSIADESGQSASSLGSVIVEVDGQEIDTITSTFQKEGIDYGSTITLKAKANAHCFFEGFYNSNGKVSDVGVDGEYRIFTFNLTADSNIVVRFETQKVNLIVDTSAYENVAFTSPDFVVIEQGKYQWTTDFVMLNSLKMKELPLPELYGHNFAGFLFGSALVDAEAKVSSLVEDATSKLVTLLLETSFQPVDVIVTLDYGYSDSSSNPRTKEIVAKFGTAYYSAADWDANAIRIGFTFVGWFDGAKRITESTLVTNAQAHTLTARWQAKTYRVEIVSPHASMSAVANAIFVESGNSYVAHNVEYGAVITFLLTPHKGYEILDNWSENFVVSISAQGVASVKFTMPDVSGTEGFVFAVPTTAKQNTVSVVGENLADVWAYDITDQQSDIPVEDGALKLETGKTLKLEIAASKGFNLKETPVFVGSVNSYTESGVLIVVYDSQTRLRVKSSTGAEGSLVLEIEGINRDVIIKIETTPKKNTLTLNFSRADAVEEVYATGNTISSVPESLTFEAETGTTFEVYLKHNFGFMFDGATSDNFAVTATEVTEGMFKGFTLLSISNIFDDGQVNITSQVQQFTIKIVTKSFDSQQNIVEVAENKVSVDDIVTDEIQVDFGTEVVLKGLPSGLYNFAGWSKDGENRFSYDNPISYTVTKDETIFAIFSALRYQIKLGSVQYSLIYTEYDNPEKTQPKFSEMADGNYYIDGQQTDSFEIYYGTSVTLEFDVPEGFSYYGYACKVGGEYQILKRENKPGSRVEVTISSKDFGNVAIEKLYLMVTAYSLTFDVQTSISVDGQTLPDENVGQMELTDENLSGTNEFGFVDGTRVGYAKYESERKFSVVAYTADEVILKVSLAREGYHFHSISANRQDVEISLVREETGFMLYRITGLVGLMQGLHIDVAFSPNVNEVDISFADDGKDVDGGVFTIEDLNDFKQIWESGRDYSSVSVSAYTDSRFKVTAFIKAGYWAEVESLQAAFGIVDAQSVQYQTLSVEETGFTGKLSFVVSGFLGKNFIQVSLIPQTYTISLKEGNTILAKVHNVKFNGVLDLSQDNIENISIYYQGIGFVDGQLQLVLSKERHNFEGYFSYQNGVGRQYIDYQGNVLCNWAETGYYYNTISGKYALNSNATINQNGELEISIYAYLSYLKTRFDFQFVPGLINLSAADMVIGADHTNSWFYKSNPNNIEIAFDTSIKLFAPELVGFKFYKFVLSQKLADGTWLADENIFENGATWATNENEGIVDVVVEVHYFAQVDVNVLGGEGSFVITQSSADDAFAKDLLLEGFVDTRSYFTITATPAAGYEFVSWKNHNTDQVRETVSLILSTQRRMALTLRLRGLPVTLDFSEYSTRFGQILSLQALSADGTLAPELSLGSFEEKGFVKNPISAVVRVGDEITFKVKVEYGFAVTWNRDDIGMIGYANGIYSFSMIANPADANGTVAIVPTFREEILSVYISSKLKDHIDEATDSNLVAFAGYTTFNNRKTNFLTSLHNQNILIGIVANARYGVSNVTIFNYDKTYTNMSEFMTEDGAILLSEEFMEANKIVGVVNIEVEFERLYWRDLDVEGHKLVGIGTQSEPYQISSVEDLVLMMTLCNSGQTNEFGSRYADCAFEFMTNINLSHRFWTPIGTEDCPFNGTFNFHRHSITGIGHATFFKTLSYNGLFGVLGENATMLVDQASLWWIYLIAGLIVLLTAILLLSMLLNRKRKKRNEELAKR